MTPVTRKLVGACIVAAVAWLGFDTQSIVVPTAEAVRGRPATPVSYAGVARRTTVRAATPGAGAPGVGVAPVPGVGAPGVAIAIGSIVYSIPSGCVATVVNGIQYQQCGSTWYQVQSTGTSTQYVVVAPP